MIRKFDDFQIHDTFSGRLGLIGESHDMPNLFGHDLALPVIEISKNPLTTFQIFNRLAGSSFVPRMVASRPQTGKMKTPITAITPRSKIKTFISHRALNEAFLERGTLYFSKPSIKDQFQVVLEQGRITGVRQIIDGKGVHLDTSRWPQMQSILPICEAIHSKVGGQLLRFRLGLTNARPFLLMMENFKLKRPELISLYFEKYESMHGAIPAWYRHQVQNNLLKPYLNEYINREEILKKCPYIL